MTKNIIQIIVILLLLSSSFVGISGQMGKSTVDAYNIVKSTGINQGDLDFTRSVILASNSEHYSAATPLAAKYQIPLILVSEPCDRIQHFLDLYEPLHVYEIDDTPFNATILSEEDLITEGGEELNDYVVIAKENGEFSIVGEYLASLHNGTLILADSLDDKIILEHLKELQPRYCALVWTPDDFRCDLVTLIIPPFVAIAFSKSTMTKFTIDTLTKIDNDPYIDVSFGFVTGSDTTDASLLISRELIYEEIDGDWKNRALFTPPSSDTEDFCSELGVEFIGKNGTHYNAQEYLDAVKQGAKYTHFFGHGYPIGLQFDITADHSSRNVSYLTSCPKEHQRLLDKGKNSVYIPDNLTIKPTIFIMEACLAALTGNVYDPVTKKEWYDCDDFRNHSVSLKFIRAGAAAYIGSTTNGGVMSYHPYMLMSAYGWSLGDAAKHINNGFITSRYFVNPFPVALGSFEPRVVLFGDPAFTTSFPVETTQDDFYDVDMSERNGRTSAIHITHKKGIDVTFGKVEINKIKADRLKIKFHNFVFVKDKVLDLKWIVDEFSVNHFIEEDNEKINLCWSARLPSIGNNTLTIFPTRERAIFYIIDD